MHSNATRSSVSVRLLRRVLVISAAVFLNFAAAGSVLAGPVFMAYLDEAQEVPPSGRTATGVATFAFNDALTELSYELSVFGLSNITMAHIHLAPAGVNGPVVLWLYPDAPPPLLIVGETNGLLASGMATDADLVVQPGIETLADLLAELTAGNAYVNIHTVQFPPGEIRGQIRQVSEPATLPVLALGLLALVALRRRRAALDQSAGRSTNTA